MFQRMMDCLMASYACAVMCVLASRIVWLDLDRVVGFSLLDGSRIVKTVTRHIRRPLDLA